MTKWPWYVWQRGKLADLPLTVERLMALIDPKETTKKNSMSVTVVSWWELKVVSSGWCQLWQDTVLMQYGWFSSRPLEVFGTVVVFCCFYFFFVFKSPRVRKEKSVSIKYLWLKTKPTQNFSCDKGKLLRGVWDITSKNRVGVWVAFCENGDENRPSSNA